MPAPSTPFPMPFASSRHSGKRLAIAAAASLQIDGQDRPPTAAGPFRWSWTWTSRPGQIVRFQRIVALVRSDSQASDPGSAAQDQLGGALRLGCTGLVAAHEAAWADRWRCSDVEVEGDPAAQRALRFAAYHLNGAVGAANFGYYEPRCGHGSSLSTAMHGLVRGPAGRQREGAALLLADRGD